jgi:hypothetical protein
LLACILPLAEVAVIVRKEARKAYERRYYHTKAKAQRRAYQLATRERDRTKRQAEARARYWRNPEPFRAAARERMNALYRQRRAVC